MANWESRSRMPSSPIVCAPKFLPSGETMKLVSGDCLNRDASASSSSMSMMVTVSFEVGSTVIFDKATTKGSHSSSVEGAKDLASSVGIDVVYVVKKGINRLRGEEIKSLNCVLAGAASLSFCAEAFLSISFFTKCLCSFDLEGLS